MAILTSHERIYGGGRAPFSPFGWRKRGWRWCYVFGLWFTLCGLAAPRVGAQNLSREYALKAVFLLNLARFTEWPTNAFDGPAAPLVIGIWGDDPFGPLLEQAVSNEQVRGRKFVINHLARRAEIGACHILFVSQSESHYLEKIVTAIKGRPVLSVSEIEGAARRGACVELRKENNKIKLVVNLDSLQGGGLVMSSKLLRVSEIVPAMSNDPNL